MARPWVLTKGLENLRAEVNKRWPDRDKESDGTIGDLAHMQGTSSHNPEDSGHADYVDGDNLNEVRGWDMDNDLHDRYGKSAEDFVQFLLSKFRAMPKGTEPIRYMIYNRRIWEASNGWKQRAYTGASAHTEHIHFSGQRTQAADNWNGQIGIATFGIPEEEEDVPTPEEYAAAVWNYDVDRAKAGTQTAAGYLTTENARSGESRTVIEPAQAEALDAVQAEQKAQRALLEQILNRLPATPEQ